MVKEEFMKEFLEKKYNNEYFSALQKNWLEIPANKLYCGVFLDTGLELDFTRLFLWNLRKFDLEEKDATKAE